MIKENISDLISERMSKIFFGGELEGISQNPNKN